MEKIRVENLTFSYPNSRKAALENINMKVLPGEFVVVCGGSGSGKTTLLRLLKPVIAPFGEKTANIYIDGKNVDELSEREQAEEIGYVMQNPDSQIVCDKVWHELAFGLESLSCGEEEIRTRVAEMASFFGIQSWFYKKVSELSGGQKQLLNLASVMVMRPSVLILDEPTSQLDPIAAHDFLQAVFKINRELGTTVILSEHRLEEAIPLADKVAVIENSHLLIFGTPQNTARFLKETNNIMYAALPTSVRIFYEANGEGECPKDVRSARKWLGGMPKNENIAFADKKSMCEEDAIRLKNVWFRYEKDLPDILKGLSFCAKSGEIYAIVGGNGVGKSTALSVIAGIKKPYRGSVEILNGKCTALLPQNPETLFCRKTVLSELQSMTKDRAQIDNVIEFCELEDFCGSHPYDLSGGEKQRVALAMLLLKNPDILLLDEPTKGFDAAFKIKFAHLLKRLKNNGICVIMVSHDIEFCAKYADRCAMMFDGKKVAEDSPRQFCGQNSFYTTAANRISKNIIPGAVLEEDILKSLGIEVKDEDISEEKSVVLKRHNSEDAPKKKKLSPVNFVLGGISIAALGFSMYLCKVRENTVFWQIVSMVFAWCAGICLIPKREFGIQNIKRERLSKRTLAAAFMILLLIPITIFFGTFYLGDRKYYFISLLVILETSLPFFMIFEKRKPMPRELIMISVLSAISVAGRMVFAPFPQFKPVAALVIITGVTLGAESGFLVGAVGAFVSNFYFSQGPWTPWQMFSFGIIGFLAGVIFQKGILRKNKTELCLFGFLTVFVIYGGIMDSASVVIWQQNPTRAMFWANIVSGIPFNLVHAFSTVLFLWFGAEPMCEKIERVKVKYGLIE